MLEYAHTYTEGAAMTDEKPMKDRNRIHLYWTEEQRVALVQVGEKLETQGVRGLTKRDGSYNASAIIAELMRRELERTP